MKDPLIGQQLANFRVERLLEQGGMGAVYYGQDVQLQRPVAIKLIDKRYKNDAALAKRFVNEALMMAKWRHENIVQVYYADDTQGFSYYVMEYVDGQDLSTVMSLYTRENKLMPIANVLRIGNAVAHALDYAHHYGVIHRDLKPSNILIAKDGRTLLADFGMALAVRDGLMGNVVGTLHYISPEQARRSADAVPQSDLYSLGVILYEMLTGATPFTDASPVNIALQHISEAPPPPRSINPELSPAVETVLLKALEKKPQNRFQFGARLMAALDDAVKAADSASKPAPPALPVEVPTIKRSGISAGQNEKPEAPNGTTDPIHKSESKVSPEGDASIQPHGRNKWSYAVLILVLIPGILGIAGWLFAKNIPLSIAETAAPTLTSPLPTLTDMPAQSTQRLPSRSAVPTQAPALLLIEPSPTLPQVLLTSAAAVTAISTIKYPDGNNFTLFWNETSFVMLNRSRARRSYSSFTFERLNKSGMPTDRFYGYFWFDVNTKYLPSKTCLNINIVEDNVPPYIFPSDCANGYLSTARPHVDKDGERIFWNAKEGSTQFRLLWSGEEVARCEISAEVCEVYIP